VFRWWNLWMWRPSFTMLNRRTSTLRSEFCARVNCIGGHRHRPQYRRYPTSDIDICYSDIGRKYFGLKTVIPISEGFRYRHLSPFRYPICKKYLSHQQDSNPRHLFSQPLCWFMNFWMSDIGYQIKVYSDIRYNVGLCSLQSDIGSSDIKLSPISLITDIGVSAHLWSIVRRGRSA
jgi:hypothetical protein